jgi:HlyD family secretion protein
MTLLPARLERLLPARLERLLPASASADDPNGEIRTGVLVIGAFLGLVTLWGLITPLDAAATASGQISVSGHDQVIQHREGGVVAAVDVVEGQHVKAGQVLIELAPEDVGAQVRSLRAQLISLQAQRARLTAEVNDLPAIQWPASFATLSGDDLRTAVEATQSQQAQFNAGLGALRAQQAINARKAAGLSQQIAGSQGQFDSVRRQQVLLDQQLEGVRSLAEKGYASQNSVRALERSAADLAGSRAQHAADVADFRQQEAEAQLQSANLEKERAQTAAAALRETEDQLNDVSPKLEAARSQLQRGTLRALTDGTVTGLSVFAPGAVVAPGQRIMEIVPSRPTLVVDARLPSAEVEGVRVGQKGQLRILSLSARRVPVLTGTVTQVSADSLTDERTGQSYYEVQLTVPQDQLDIIHRIPDADSGMRPGVPAQVVIPLRKRTALEYLFEPLTQSLWASFRQR